MLYGMGTVVIFLAVLVVSNLGMSWFVRRYFAEAEVEDTQTRIVEADAGSLDPRLLKIIKAAVDQHRAKSHR